MIISEGKRIRIVRVMLGLNSSQFADKIGVQVSTLSLWENGHSSPARDRRERLAELCQSSGIAFLPSGFPIPISDLVSPKETI